MIGTLTISNLQYADALCVRNQDWPASPCYGCPGCSPTLEKQKEDWAPYYDYKGSEFMEQKKQEMINAIKNNQLDEWLGSGLRDQNSNVYHYYELHGGLDESILLAGLIDDGVYIIAASSITLGIAVFILKRK